MPRITISEEDLTISNEVEALANVVYIPGMTIKEVDEKPVLFTSVSKFKETYGELDTNTGEYKPHKFVNAQVVNGETIIAANEYEKSYIYAVELLSVGTPIYFQNIVKIDEADDTDALQDFYIRLGAYKGNSKTFDNTIISVGDFRYDGAKEIFTELNVPYELELNKTETNAVTYNVLGFLPYDKDTTTNTYLGLPEGNRFTVKLNYAGINNKADLPSGTICTVEVSDGTTNTYNKDAFEDDGSLITVLNVTKESIVDIEVTWVDEDIVNGEETEHITVKKNYKFTFEDATFGEENETFTITSVYSEILDKWTYNIKFITTGGYPAMLNTEDDFALFNTLSKAATVRGDAVALIDIPYNQGIFEAFTNINKNIDLDDKTIYTLKGSNKCNLEYKLNPKRKDESTLKYATILGPLGTYELLGLDIREDDSNTNTADLPGSFGYLLSFANNIDTLNNPDYLAIAGVTRGLVPHLKQLIIETTGAEAEAVQVRPNGDEDIDIISLNPIVKIQNYGYCIWGNRTLFPNPRKDLAASSFLNIRVMSADVKKVIYNACQKLTFETNNIELWLKFKAEVEPILEKMIANGALERYELTKLASTEKATLSVYVKLVTLYAVEDFDITVGLTDSTVEEAE